MKRRHFGRESKPNPCTHSLQHQRRTFPAVVLKTFAPSRLLSTRTSPWIRKLVRMGRAPVIRLLLVCSSNLELQRFPPNTPPRRISLQLKCARRTSRSSVTMTSYTPRLAVSWPACVRPSSQASCLESAPRRCLRRSRTQPTTSGWTRSSTRCARGTSRSCAATSPWARAAYKRAW